MFKTKKILIFIHVPKCGGSSLNHAIASGMKEEEFLPVHYSRIGNLARKNKELFTRDDVNKYLGNMNLKEKSKIRFIAGHLAYYGVHKFFKDEAQYITYFRHPLERSWSHYLFLCHREKTGHFLTDSQKIGLKDASGKLHRFSDWLENNPRFHNYMVNFFKGIPEVDNVFSDSTDLLRIKEQLAGSFIGLTETLDNDLNYFFWRWPISSFQRRNVSNFNCDIKNDRSCFDVVKKYCALDLELYQWACDRHAQFTRHRWDYYPIVYMTHMVRWFLR